MRQASLRCLPHILYYLKLKAKNMEISYNKLKQKEVVNLTDGKNLGKVCDIIYFYPENKIKGYFVTGCKGFRFSKQEIFIPVCDISKIGEDVILINYDEKNKQENCPPPKKRGRDRQPQECPPNDCVGDERRGFEEYE
jgi:sporulation protein YlmC with PRC-barrel domain